MNRFILIIALSLLTLPLVAQVHWGAYVGINNSNYTIDDVKHKISFNGALLGNYRFSSYFVLQGELGISIQGARIILTEATETEAESTVSLSLNYITLPVVAKLYPLAMLYNDKRDKGFYIEAGPRMSFRVYSKILGLEDEAPDARKFEFGALGGIGYDFPGGYFVNIRYIRDFTSVLPDVYGKPKNIVYQLNLGWKIVW